MTIQMNSSYTKSVRDKLLNVRVVYDRFLVIQNLVDACDRLLKAESPTDAGKRDRLEQTRWMWLVNQGNWTEKLAHE